MFRVRGRHHRKFRRRLASEVEQCVIEWGIWQGIMAGTTGTIITNCVIANNGMFGLSTSWTNNQILGNFFFSKPTGSVKFKFPPVMLSGLFVSVVDISAVCTKRTRSARVPELIHGGPTSG